MPFIDLQTRNWWSGNRLTHLITTESFPLLPLSHMIRWVREHQSQTTMDKCQCVLLNRIYALCTTNSIQSLQLIHFKCNMVCQMLQSLTFVRNAYRMIRRTFFQSSWGSKSKEKYLYTKHRKTFLRRLIVRKNMRRNVNKN